MKRIILSLSILLTAIMGINAQQPKKVTKKWFPNPDVRIETPAFSRSYGFTTYKQMMKYISNEVAVHPQQVSVKSVGKTQRGREIPMVVVTDGKSDAGKLRVLYTGCVHGNEHAGTEGLLWFIHQLTTDSDLGQLLKSMDFYIMPMVNADGSEADNRYTHNGTDANRDQTRMSTPEVQCLQSVAAMVMPHVFIDFHEYKPLRTSYGDLSDRLISNPNDYMYLYSSNPNVCPALTDIVENYLIPDAEQMARKWGLRTSLYYTTKSDATKGTIMSIGGHASRSTSNIMALRGCVSMLMEIRGVGLGRTSYLRRVNTIYQLACSYGRTAVRCAEEIRKATDAAACQTTDIVTRYTQPTEKDHPFEFIDLLANTIITIPVDARPAKGLVATKKVSRPKAYYIDARATTAIELIKQFGIKCEELKSSQTMSLETYHVTAAVPQRAEVLNMHPVNVSVTTAIEQVTLPAGSLCVPMDQPLSTLAAILLEPECSNGFVNFHVVEPQPGEMLPLYRCIQ